MYGRHNKQHAPDQETVTVPIFYLRAVLGKIGIFTLWTLG
jgi:hypothetical protein